MSYKIRNAAFRDTGTLAHMMLVWDAELPTHVRTLKGDAAYAERVAYNLVSDPSFVTRVLEVDGNIVGAYTISKVQGIFGAVPFGILNLMVYPKHRGGKLYGLRLLKDSVSEAKKAGVGWLESHPWADAHGMHFVLECLGFSQMSRGYALKLR